MGIDANPMCLGKCHQRQAGTPLKDAMPESRVSWLSWDCLGLTPKHFLSITTNTSQLVLYVYQSASHVARLQPMLVEMVMAGARLVTYCHHLHLPPADDSIHVENKYGDMLKVYKRNTEALWSYWDAAKSPTSVAETPVSTPATRRRANSSTVTGRRREESKSEDGGEMSTPEAEQGEAKARWPGKRPVHLKKLNTALPVAPGDVTTVKVTTPRHGRKATARAATVKAH